jgi:hypothetical protein
MGNGKLLANLNNPKIHLKCGEVQQIFGSIG